jgi:hypothetical protein
LVGSVERRRFCAFGAEGEYLLLSVVAGLVFDWVLTEILAQVILVAVGGTALLTATAIYEGWHF